MSPLRATMRATITYGGVGALRFVTVQHEPTTDLLVFDLGGDHTGVPVLRAVPLRLIHPEMRATAADRRLTLTCDRDAVTIRFADGLGVEVDRTDLVTFAGDIRYWSYAEAQFGRAA